MSRDDTTFKSASDEATAGKYSSLVDNVRNLLCPSACLSATWQFQESEALISASSTDVMVPATHWSTLGDHVFPVIEHGHGMHYHPVSPPPPRHPSLHSGDFWKLSYFSDNCMDNINYCLGFWKMHALGTMLILSNWIELNWTEELQLFDVC